MSFCRNCGAPVDPNAKFCSVCGAKQERVLPPNWNIPGEQNKNDGEKEKSPKEIKKRNGVLKSIIIIVVIVSILLFCASYRNRGDLLEEESTYTHYYTNLKGENFSFNTSLQDAVIYEKKPSELIQEWNDNVALAEKNYQKDNVFVIVEGYIENISKNEFDNDTYYISITDDDSSWNLFGINSLRIYFHNNREYEALLNYKCGDYITLLCTISDTTLFLEYPSLEANLVLEPVAPIATENIEAENLAMVDYIGLTVRDIEYFYGKDYTEDLWDSNLCMVYSDGANVPYLFSVPYTFDAEGIQATDSIVAVESEEDGIKIIGKAAIGGKVTDLAEELNQEIYAYGNEESGIIYNLPWTYIETTMMNQREKVEKTYGIFIMTDEAKENVVYVKISQKGY